MSPQVRPCVERSVLFSDLPLTSRNAGPHGGGAEARGDREPGRGARGRRLLLGELVGLEEVLHRPGRGGAGARGAEGRRGRRSAELLLPR